MLSNEKRIAAIVQCPPPRLWTGAERVRLQEASACMRSSCASETKIRIAEDEYPSKCHEREWCSASISCCWHFSHGPCVSRVPQKDESDQPSAISDDSERTAGCIPAALRQPAGHLPEPSESVKAEVKSRERRRAEKADARTKKKLAKRLSHVFWCSLCKRSPRKPAGRRDGGKQCLPPTTFPSEPHITTRSDEEVVFCGQCPRMMCLARYIAQVEEHPDKAEWVSLRGCKNV